MSSTKIYMTDAIELNFISCDYECLIVCKFFKSRAMDVISANRAKLKMIVRRMMIEIVIFVVKADYHYSISTACSSSHSIIDHKFQLPNPFTHRDFYLCMGITIRKCKKQKEGDPETLVGDAKCFTIETKKCMDRISATVLHCTIDWTKYMTSLNVVFSMGIKFLT